MSKTGPKKSSPKTKAIGKKTSASAKKRKESSKKPTLSAAGKTVKRKAAKSPEPETGEIPKLDLAKQILAEERKATSARRKGPGGRSKAATSKPEVKPVSRATGRPVPELSERDQIITQIVARDIEKLCAGDVSNA